VQGCVSFAKSKYTTLPQEQQHKDATAQLAASAQQLLEAQQASTASMQDAADKLRFESHRAADAFVCRKDAMVVSADSAVSWPFTFALAGIALIWQQCSCPLQYLCPVSSCYPFHRRMSLCYPHFPWPDTVILRWWGLVALDRNRSHVQHSSSHHARMYLCPCAVCSSVQTVAGPRE
jgi:hypothetical protein